MAGLAFQATLDRNILYECVWLCRSTERPRHGGRASRILCATAPACCRRCCRRCWRRHLCVAALLSIRCRRSIVLSLLSRPTFGRYLPLGIDWGFCREQNEVGIDFVSLPPLDSNTRCRPWLLGFLCAQRTLRTRDLIERMHRVSVSCHESGGPTFGRCLPPVSPESFTTWNNHGGRFGPRSTHNAWDLCATASRRVERASQLCHHHGRRHGLRRHWLLRQQTNQNATS